MRLGRGNGCRPKRNGNGLRRAILITVNGHGETHGLQPMPILTTPIILPMATNIFHRLATTPMASVRPVVTTWLGMCGNGVKTTGMEVTMAHRRTLALGLILLAAPTALIGVVLGTASTRAHGVPMPTASLRRLAASRSDFVARELRKKCYDPLVRDNSYSYILGTDHSNK